MYEEMIAKLERQNSKVVDKLENIAVQAVKRSTTTNITNTTIHIENLTDEWLKESSEKLTMEYIKKGLVGYAEFAASISLKDRVICTDFARRILQYKEFGQIVRDKKGIKLSKKFFDSIEDKNKDLILQSMANLTEEMDNATPEQLDKLIEKMDKFVEMKGFDVVNDKSLRDKFIGYLCEII